MSIEETLLRLLSALMVGGLIGLNRQLHGKPAGLRTFGLVALGAAMATLAGTDFVAPGRTDPNALSRIIQGVVAGIGFLGVGVIVRGVREEEVHGLTTAAALWTTASLGIVCGLGNWQLASAASFFVLLLLAFGGAIERWAKKHTTGGGDAP